MQIHYGAKISRGEYLRAFQLHYKPGRFWIGVMVVSVLLLLSSFAILVMRVPSQIAIFSFQMFPEYLFVLLVLAYPWWIPYMYLPSYGKRSNAYRGHIQGVIDETEVTIEAEYSKSQFQWLAFERYKMGKDIALLYVRKGAFTIFARSMFSSAEDWDGFISLLKAKVSRK